MVVDQVERVAEDQPADVVAFEERSREAELDSTHGAQPLDVLIQELDVEDAQVVAELDLGSRAENRDQRPRLRAHPGEGDLRGGRADLGADGDHLAGDRVDPIAGAVVPAWLVRLVQVLAGEGASFARAPGPYRQ